MTRMTRVTLLRRPTASKEKNKNDIVRAVIQTITANLSFKRLFVNSLVLHRFYNRNISHPTEQNLNDNRKCSLQI